MTDEVNNRAALEATIARPRGVRLRAQALKMYCAFMSSEKRSGADHIQSLERGLAVIRSFTADSPKQTLSDVARATGLSRATARRLLLTLEHLGYVRLARRDFQLTPRVLDLGYAYLLSTGIEGIASPYLQEFSDRMQMTSSVAVLDDTEVVYVARARTRSILTLSIGVGTRLPAVQTSLGRVFLAELGEAEVSDIWARTDRSMTTERTVSSLADLMKILAAVRAQGWALNDQELEVGIRSLAVPLRDAVGQVVAAMNMSSTTSQHTTEELLEVFLPGLLETAGKISGNLGMRPTA